MEVAGCRTYKVLFPPCMSSPEGMPVAVETVGSHWKARGWVQESWFLSPEMLAQAPVPALLRPGGGLGNARLPSHCGLQQHPLGGRNTPWRAVPVSHADETKQKGTNRCCWGKSESDPGRGGGDTKGNRRTMEMLEKPTGHSCPFLEGRPRRATTRQELSEKGDDNARDALGLQTAALERLGPLWKWAGQRRLRLHCWLSLECRPQWAGVPTFLFIALTPVHTIEASTD